MNIMTKRGNLDNIVTYEHICDTKDDLAKISKQYTTLGSVAIVIKGEDDLLEAYMATSKGEWVPIMVGGNASGGGGESCDCPHLIVEMTEVEDTTISDEAITWYNLVGNHTFAEIYDAFINGSVRFNFGQYICDIMQIGHADNTDTYSILFHPATTIMSSENYPTTLLEYLKANNLAGYIVLNSIPYVYGTTDEYPIIRKWRGWTNHIV